MPKVFLSPSNQTANLYAYGNTNESVQCNKIAQACKDVLIKNGIDTKLMHLETLGAKVREGNAWGADLYVCIHTNACDGKVTGTRIFSYDKGESYKACKAVFDVLAPITIGTSESITQQPQLYEIKNTKAPTVYIEVDFHDVPNVAKWIIENTKLIGETIAKGILNYFGIKQASVNDSQNLYRVQLGAFSNKDNADALLKKVKAAGFTDAFIKK